MEFVKLILKRIRGGMENQLRNFGILNKSCWDNGLFTCKKWMWTPTSYHMTKSTPGGLKIILGKDLKLLGHNISECSFERKKEKGR